MAKQKKKKKKKANKKNATQVILMTDEETDEEDSDEEEDEDESGMHFEKEDVQLIYNALKNYRPTEDEKALYYTWLEMLEETLVVDYGVKLPGFEDMDEEDE